MSSLSGPYTLHAIGQSGMSGMSEHLSPTGVFTATAVPAEGLSESEQRSAAMAEPALEKTTETRVDTMRKWLDRVGKIHGWSAEFPSTYAAATSIVKILPAPATGKKGLQRYCSGLDEAGCISAFRTVQLPADLARLVHAELGGTPAVAEATAKRKRDDSHDHALAPPTNEETAKSLYGTCGYCPKKLEDAAWRPLVTGEDKVRKAACDECYGAQATVGAAIVELKRDMSTHVVSVAAAIGYVADLEEKLVANVRQWSELRMQLESRRHMVQGSRSQVPLHRGWGDMTAAEKKAWYGKRIGGALARDTAAYKIYGRIAAGAIGVLERHKRRIEQMYDIAFGTHNAGEVRFFAPELVDVEGWADWQFVHNEKIPAGYMQVAVFLTDADSATVHMWWKPGGRDAGKFLWSLRNKIVGNDGVAEDVFKAEIAQDGDLGAVAAATTEAELNNVGTRRMFPHPVKAGHLQGFVGETNHFGCAVPDKVVRTLLVVLVTRGEDGETEELEAQQMHGATKVMRLGLHATAFHSKRLQKEYHSVFLRELDETTAMLNPAYKP